MRLCETKASLSPARRRLLELMQRVNFGRIENMVVRDGEPVFDPRPRAVRDIKFCAENGPRPELAADDFPLKGQVVDLFRRLDKIGIGTIELIEVKHGLPFLMSVEETAV